MIESGDQGIATTRLTSAGESKVVDVRLVGQGEIQVQLRDVDGQPVEGARVTVSTRFPFPQQEELQSDAQGLAVFPAVFAGDYTISATKPAPVGALSGSASGTLLPSASDSVEIEMSALPIGRVRGVVLQPEMRQSQGLFFNLPISENLLLGREAARDGWVRPLGRERAECEALLTRWGIKAASIDVPPDSLSGGNQQKVVLAKWLLTAPRILLLDEPTKGVDVGAKHDIHHLIREEAALGMGCLVVSSDLPELLALADRIVVLKQGRVQGELLRGASEEDVMHLATRADESDAA